MKNKQLQKKSVTLKIKVTLFIFHSAFLFPLFKTILNNQINKSLTFVNIIIYK